MDGQELRIIKIGLDIDNSINPEKTLNLIKQGYKRKVERVNVYSSASGKGLHFELYLKSPVSIGESFEIRENLGDDQKRLIFSRADYERGWDFDILFTHKKINGQWKTRRFLFEELI